MKTLMSQSNRWLLMNATAPVLVVALGIALAFTPAFAGEAETSSQQKNLSPSRRCVLSVIANETLDIMAKNPDWDSSIALCKVATRIESEIPILSLSYLSLAMAYEGKEQLDAAIASYKEALRLNPDSAPSHYGLGRAYRKKRQWDAAITSYKKVIRLEERWDGYYGLGEAYSRKGQWNAAIAQYKKALRLNPDSANTHYELGYAYGRRGKWSAAIASLNEAIRLEPQHVKAYITLGMAYWEKDQPDAAIASFKTAIRLRPELPLAHYSFGTFYIFNEEESLAADHIYKAANLYLNQGNREGAVKSYELLRKLESPLADRIFRKLYP